jgi:hypothetical protein
MSFKITGLDKLEKQLNKMEKAAKDLEGNSQVSFENLFVKSFMLKYTNFSTFDDFLQAGNFIVNSQEDFEAIPDDDMDCHVQSTTKFSSWDEMLGSATEKYVAKQLGF